MGWEWWEATTIGSPARGHRHETIYQSGSGPSIDMLRIPVERIVDTLIISQGSMLMSGATTPRIPGTPAGDKAKGNITPVVRADPGLSSKIRRNNSSMLKAAVTPNYPKPAASRVGQGPSTFVQKVLGGHLTASWLFASFNGR